MSAKRKSEFENALLKIHNPEYVAEILRRKRAAIVYINDLKSIFNAGRRAERRGKKG